MTAERHRIAVSTVNRRKGGLPAAPAAYGSTATEPSFKESNSPANAPPGILISIQADWFFDNAGTNPRITGRSSPPRSTTPRIPSARTASCSCRP